MSKTVKVRIAVAVDETGAWSSSGWGGPKASRNEGDMMAFAVESLEDGERRYWLEAELEVPETPVISGTVTEATAD